MTRGEAHQTKVHFKGKEDDFVVFVDDAKSAQDWRMNKSIPLERVVSALQIFVTHKHGSQGPFDGASHSTLDNEFGTHDEEMVMKQILEKGTLQECESAERQGSKNDSKGARPAQ